MAEYICTVCGWEGEKRRKPRGSKAMEIFIWTVLFVPGPFYSIWRRVGKDNACPNCHLPKLVKLSSDEGWFARRKFDIEMGIAPPAKEVKKDELASFGNDKPALDPANKKPVDPDQW